MGKEEVRALFKSGRDFSEPVKVGDFEVTSVDNFVSEEYDGETAAFKLKVVSLSYLSSEDIEVIFEIINKSSGETSFWKFSGFYNSYDGIRLDFSQWRETYFEVTPKEKLTVVFEKK